MAGHGKAWPGQVRLGRLARPGTARQGDARRGEAGMVRPGAAWPGEVWQGMAGKARQGMTWRGTTWLAWPGRARHGKARQAWRGAARQGMARYGRRGFMLYTITEAAALLRLHRNTIRAMMNDGRLEAIDLNPEGGRRTWRVNVDGLLHAGLDPNYLDIKRRAGL